MYLPTEPDYSLNFWLWWWAVSGNFLRDAEPLRANGPAGSPQCEPRLRDSALEHGDRFDVAGVGEHVEDAGVR